MSQERDRIAREARRASPFLPRRCPVKVFPLLTVPLFLLITCFSRAGDWPGWRGPTRGGHTAETDLPLTWDGKKGENVLWKVNLEDFGHYSPIVWGDHVFVNSSERPKAKAIPTHSVT